MDDYKVYAIFEHTILKSLLNISLESRLTSKSGADVISNGDYIRTYSGYEIPVISSRMSHEIGHRGR